MRLASITLLLASALSLHADALSDLKSSLSRFPGRSPIQVQLRYQTNREASRHGAPAISNAQVTVDVIEDLQSLKMIWDAKDARRVNEEARAHDHDSKSATPLREAMKDLDPGRLSHLVNQSGILEGLLEDSKFVSESSVAYEGKPARLLTFTFAQRLPSSVRSRLIRSDASLKIWVNAEGLPIASESVSTYSGRRGRIFGNYSGGSKMRTHYAAVQDRLLAVDRSTEETQTDDGESVSARKEIRLQPR